MTLEEHESIVELATALARVRECETAPLAERCALLDDAEQRVFRHKDRFGVMSSRFQLGCEEFVLLSNTVAMHALQLQPLDLAVCTDLLTRAEQHTRRSGYLRSLVHDNEVEHASRRLELRLICLNNLACLHKETAKPLAALRFLEKALKIQMKQATALRAQKHIATDDDDGTETAATASAQAIALTHLNLCAVLSQLKRHAAAAEHAKSSVALLYANGRAIDAQLALVAHFNWGVELEHLSDDAQALRAYTTALQIAKTYGIARSESELVRTIEAIVSEHHHTQLSHRAAALKRAAAHSHRPLSPRTLRQTTTS